MSGFDLPNNYTDNPKALLRKNWSRTASSSATPLSVEPVTPVTSAITEMAKSLHDYSTLAIANVPIGPAINTGTRNFELHTILITMVQANQFYGLPSEDASAHLQHFLELCDIIVIKDVELASIRLCPFPFSLVGKAKQWFYKEKEAISTWDKCSVAFLVKIFPMGKTNALRGKFQTSSKLQWSPSLRRGRGCRITSKPARTTEWIIGSYSITSMKGLCPCRRGT